MSSPYKDKEKAVMSALAEAWNNYVDLDITHPQHNNDFGKGIRDCQNVIQHRILQRDYPETFPTHSPTNTQIK